MEAHPLAGLSVGPAPVILANYLVILCDQLFDREMQIGHDRVHPRHHLFVA